MHIYIHRVNTLEKLAKVPSNYGIEVDLRTGSRDGSQKIIMHHDPFSEGIDFELFMKEYHHKGIILNIKEAGIEERVWDIVKKYGAEEGSWLLDVEFPYMYQASRGINGKRLERRMAVRYSEAEPIEFTEAQDGYVDWIWIDTNTQLPLNAQIIARLRSLKMKTCLVCPERWARANDIVAYQKQMDSMSFKPDAVMTALEYVPYWESWVSVTDSQ